MRHSAQHRCTRGWPAFLFALLAQAAGAVTVHTWIDEQGVRHFADQPPADAAESGRIELAEQPPAAGADDYYSILNQWSRLREEREAADAFALERERLRLDARPQAPLPPERSGGYPLGYAPYGPALLPGLRGFHGRRPRADYLVDKRRRGGFVPLPAPRFGP